MDQKDTKFYILVIVFFALGLVIGYLIHQPGSEIRYINIPIEETTKELPKVVATTVEVTATPTANAITHSPTSTPVPDFEVKIYDPEKDKPTNEILLVNTRKAMPDFVSMHPGGTVLIKVVNYPDQLNELEFNMGSYKQKLGTSGMIVIKFNNIGTYTFTAIIPNDDPSINPVKYAEGSIKVY